MIRMINEYDRFHNENIRDIVIQKYGSRLITGKYLDLFKHIGD